MWSPRRDLPGLTLGYELEGLAPQYDLTSSGRIMLCLTGHRSRGSSLICHDRAPR
jgi:hypothetical protein